MEQVALSAFVKSIVEKTINGGSSLISDQLLKVVFREENMRKYEILLDKLDLELEETQHLPIMKLQLRRNLDRLKDEHKKRRDLLNKHKQQPAESHEENGQQAVTVSSRYFPAPFDIIKSLFSDNVQDIQWFVEEAKHLLTKVSLIESDEQIRQNPRRPPLVRQLIKREGISIAYSTSEGSQKRMCCIWPFYLQERGVEAALRFQYSDSIIPGKSFTMDLFLRLRESTDIVGIAIRCLNSIPSQLKLVRDSAKCELDKLSKLRGDFSSHGYWYSDSGASNYMAATVKFRPDSFCCAADADGNGPCANSTVVSSASASEDEFSDKLPEEISYFNFNCHVGGAVNDNVASSSKDARPRPLEVDLSFAPHALSRAPLGGMGGKKEHEVSSLQQFLENVAQNATENFVHQPQFTSHASLWFINHGFVRVGVSKSTI